MLHGAFFVQQKNYQLRSMCTCFIFVLTLCWNVATKYDLNNIFNGRVGPLPQVRVGRVCTCMLARCRVVSAKLDNQNVRLPVFDCIG